MEADHTAQDDPPEGSEEVEKEDPGNWRKRLRLKQVAVQLPVIQNIDEGYGAEESEEGLEKNKVQTARKSFKRPPLRGQDVAPGPGISGKILRFSCSECTGQATFSPNDLLKHFQGVHQGSLPTFPCDMCSFVTHDFSSLQRHRIGHRDTFVRCDICNDGIQYTLLQLTRHFNMFHSLNGFYCCEKCKFSTKDVGTFVQHTHRHNDALYKCSKCQHISHGSGEHQKHILTHSGPYPFSCQFCDYGAPRKDYVAKHMAAVHREEMERLNKRRASEDGQKTLVNSTPGLKLLLTKNPARQTHWMSKGLHALSGGGLLDEYGRLANPEKTLEETQQFLERTVAAQRDCKKWAKGLKSEQQYTSQTVPATAQPKQEPAVSPNAGFLNPNSNGLTVLMVKNKITIPPNCTTKVMGFKMVDGKKHLVLKVIPSAKQEPCAKTEDSLVATSVASASSVAEKEADDNALEPCKGEANTLASSEEGTGPPSGHLDSSNSEVPPNPKVSPNGVAPPGSPCSLPSRMENIDIASALVQVQAQENGEQEQELVSTTAREVEEEQPPGATENDDDAAPSPPSSPAANAVSLVSKVTEQSSLIQCEDDGSPNGETSSPIPVATDPSLEKNTPKHTDPDEFDPSPNFLESTAIECMSSKSPLSSPSQEVFTFHNYSKDTSSLSSDASLLSDEQQSTQLLTVESENDGVHILRPSHDSNLTLESLPLQVLQNRLEDQDRIVEPCVDLPEQRLLNSDPPSMEKVPDNEIEVDECVATVEVEGDTKESEVKCQNLDSSEGLNATLDSKFQCQEQCSEPPSIDGGAKVGKGEEHLDSPSESQEHSAKNVEGPNVADGEKASGSSNNAAILGKILEEHSDAIISQQLEKERIGTAVPHEAIRTPTTTLRILQPLNLSDGTKTSESQDFVQTLATASPLLSFSSIAPTQGKASEKHGGEGLACKLKKARLPSPRRSHQGAKRKRSKKPSMEDSLESPAKARRLSSKKSKEKEAPAVMYWEPAPREEERTLRLLPLSTVQPVKCPRRNQPVVVLNHPDADIPEVASLMRTVNKFRGEVTKVALSQRTVAALSELDCSTFRQDRSANCHPTHGRRVRPEGTVRERFILKLRLKKTSRNKYKVVNTSSDSTEWSSTFSCWFCGRIFDNQEEWIGHGQRHLMEATRDWNKLFS
ncbi:zinc finger protein 518A isoform X2 [Conger conger]|uniref:zinc finger protein 518A isoform X2 n=1 Tax=Conger conger TaxID=82655 RepID=UPI002A5ABBEE|nr:zinc finger protein 518A isoform X2 [Conger conger]